MKQTDNIDLLIVLEEHGWSSVFLFINGFIHEFPASHTFSDPLTDFSNLCLALLANSAEEELIWYSEPGGYKWDIRQNQKEQHKISVDIQEILDEFGEKITKTKPLLNFEIKTTQFIKLIYHQLLKISELLKEKSYAKNRQEEFPFDLFNELQSKIETQTSSL